MEDPDFRPTPLVRLARFQPGAALYAKMELLHPSGSAYDRIARPLLEGTGGPAIVAGAGSVALAFCRAAALLDRQLVVVCPESTLPEHLDLIRQHAARLVPVASGLLEAHERAEALAAEVGGTVVFSIRVSEAAERLFAESLGEEIAYAFEVLEEKPEVVVAPVGAGALLGGVERALAAHRFTPRLVGTIRPAALSLQDGTVTRAEAKAPPSVELVEVTDAEAFATRMALAKSEGILVGMGSAAALRVAKARGENAVAIAVDAGDRYFSVDRRLEG